MDKHFIIALFHIFLVVPLFLGVGFLKYNVPLWVYWLLLGLGLIILVYHGRMMLKRWMMNSSYLWVNMIHFFLIAPLLIYIGYKQKETLRFAYELLLISGFGALGYHLFSVVKTIQTIETDTH
jgi:hypothetical protein